MKLNEQIERLRADGSRPEAKGRVIQALHRRHEHKTMKLIGKLSIPAALVAGVAIIGSLSMSSPALASPSSVAKAIRDVKNYVINSFTVVNGKRTLNSRTTVTDGKSSRQFFDANGNVMSEGKGTDLDGTLYELAVGKPIVGVTINKGAGQTKSDIQFVEGHPIGAKDGRKVEVKAERGKDGKLVKRTYVDGKEVKELPADLKNKVGMKIGESGRHAEGQVLEVNIGDDNGQAHTRGGYMVVEGGKDGQVSTFASGQTSVDYLLKLLDDTARWDIERGTVWNGLKLDKFTLKGQFSPIELYVDPATSLPKVLRFVGIGESSVPRVEDEYVYGALPPVK